MEPQSNMVQFSSSYRSTESEIMDDFDFNGPEMKELLCDLSRVNKWLGGTNITLSGIEELMSQTDKSLQICVLDVGCGDGEILRACAAFGKKKGYNFKLIGIDANPFIIEEAKLRSKAYNNITYFEADVFKINEQHIDYDIALCCLFLHHFKQADIIDILTKLTDGAKVGVVVNDLARSKMAFWLFKLFGSIVLKTKTAKHDGLVSVARGFRRNELKNISEKIEGIAVKIQWRWAFRFQWLLQKKK